MSTGSAIEWTDATWNPVSGCTRASAGCDNCYAVKMTNRLEKMGQSKYDGLTVLNKAGDRHFNGVVRTHDESLAVPLSWKKPRRVFVNSMSDLFHRDVPFDFIDKVFAVMALTPQHTYQVLTKRPERMAEYLARVAGRPSAVLDAAWITAWGPAETTDSFADWRERIHWCEFDRHPLPNFWLGTSVENQDAADQRIPHLLKCPAAVRFLSCEPLLGAVDLDRDIGGTLWIGGQRGCGATHRGMGTPECPREPHHHHDNRCQPGLDWVIVGGESGPGARPCNVEWIRTIVAQCNAAGVPAFVKQLGAKPVTDKTSNGTCRGKVPVEWYPPFKLHDKKGGDWTEWPDDLRVREFPEAHHGN